ncbi:MAG: hypothetical protein HUK25_09745 [Treponema sp.]|nr:hypothetical protein [Treponema sp.]
MIISFINLSCKISPHYVIKVESDEKLYSKALEGDLSDCVFDKYTHNGKIYFAVTELTNCSVSSKKYAKARFVFDVFSNVSDYYYKIEKVDLILDGEIFNINDLLIQYYPYSSEHYSAFKRWVPSCEYYFSTYHLGYINFPIPKDNKVKIMVTLSDNESGVFKFEYAYTIKSIFDLFY